MNAISALAFIALATLRNMALRQLRRIREPRYLVATLFGLFYVGNLFFRPGMGRGAVRRAHLDAGDTALLTAVLLGLGLVFILSGWLFGGDERGLAFSEAEIQFLFPAPLSRRQLIHYKLVRTLLFGLFSAAILTLSLGRGVARGSALFILGAWLGVVTLSLHLVAASLTRLSLLDHGVRGPARRALALVVPALILGAVIAGFLRVPDRWPAHYAQVAPYVEHLLATAPLSWATMILAPAVHVALAPTLTELLRWLPAALGMVAAHYVWALSTDAAFEQASIAAAERRSKRLEGMRRGQLTVRATAKAPFELSPRGHPAFAIYWKNLTAAVRLLSLRVVVVILVPVIAVGAGVALSSGAPVNRGLAAVLCAVLAASLAFFGVQIYRIDFRLDLANIDLLRSYPLRGADLALAEVLAPFTVLTLGEGVFLAAAAVLAPAEFVDELGRLPIALTLMVALPAFTLCALIVQNAAALLFPAWIQSGSAPPRGVEAIGQRLLTLVGTLLAVSLALAPAALVAGVVGALLHAPLGQAALPIAALAGGIVVAAEAGFAILGLGRAFDRFDPGR
jgi:ABC-2 type transport system permease protein